MKELLKHHSSSVILVALTLSFFFFKCGTVKLNPTIDKSIEIHKISDLSKIVTVINGMVWYDTTPPNAGIRFPPGIYHLEAESSNYLFFRSTELLEIRLFKDGKPMNGKKVHGGIMFAKNFDADATLAAGYVDSEKENEKTMIWKLGNDFLSKQGSEWKRSF